MSTATTAIPTGTTPDFKVADLSLADWGRKEIELAEQEMPGLMVAVGFECEAARSNLALKVEYHAQATIVLARGAQSSHQVGSLRTD